MIAAVPRERGDIGLLNGVGAKSGLTEGPHKHMSTRCPLYQQLCGVIVAVLTVMVWAPVSGAPFDAATPVESHRSGAVDAQVACSSLSGRNVGGARLSTEVVAAKGTIPTYCKIHGLIAPSLNFEIRLPDAWNGKLYYGGGGGYDGVIPDLVVQPLTQGYAEVASDSGHQGDGMSAEFAMNDPFAAQLFGSLSVPTVMAAAIKVVTAAYGVAPVKSYFEGCSTGGREALMVVQRNPNLFDGVIARSPAYNWVGFLGAFNRTAKALAAPGGAFTPAKTALVAKHVLAVCDGLDGIVDGVVANPAACTTTRLDIAALRCPNGQDSGASCLSDAQLAVVKSWTDDAIFEGSSSYRSKGYNLTGNEDQPMNFGVWVSGDGDVTKAGQFIIQDTTFKYYFARDPKADSLTYTPWDKNQTALFALASLNDATQTDIRPFIGAGGKLIVWHGGSDAALSVNSTIEYMQNMRRTVGEQSVASATRLYVAPGVFHCEGGPGADTTDLLSALDRWVVKDEAPATLVAQKKSADGTVLRSLPLCPYPQYPRYTGPANNAAAGRLASNYTCSAP
jgi:feruloyl esterase